MAARRTQGENICGWSRCINSCLTNVSFWRDFNWVAWSERVKKTPVFVERKPLVDRLTFVFRKGQMRKDRANKNETAPPSGRLVVSVPNHAEHSRVTERGGHQSAVRNPCQFRFIYTAKARCTPRNGTQSAINRCNPVHALPSLTLVSSVVYAFWVGER